MAFAERATRASRGSTSARLKTFGFLAAILLVACDRSSHLDTRSEPIFAAIRGQIKALNHRDAIAALACMHPQAPGLDRTRKTTEEVTATYDLIYSIQRLSLEAADEYEAKVRFTQLTQKVSGPEFRNNRVAGIHTLRKHAGTWRIYYTQVLTIDYLDK